MGPAPPAVLTAQPRVAKAATTAKMDLMKKSQRILRGWIMTRGNWTGRQRCVGSQRERLTGPEDKVRDHTVAGDAYVAGDGVREVDKRGPDGFEHDEHARGADVGVDTGGQLGYLREGSRHTQSR